MQTYEWLSETTEQLKAGAFLMVKGNPMTIGWGQFGILWGKPCATVYVRHSRHTHTLLDDCNTFTISVPALHTMASELAYCGTHSGRDENKCEHIERSLVPARFGAQDGLEGCKYHIECRILHRSEPDESLINDPVLVNRYYANGDPHSMLIGEILGVTKESL